MELRIVRDPFFKEVQKIQNITPIKATKPILSYFLLETSDDGVYLYSTDLRIGIRIYVPADVIKPGKICIPARFVYDILRELPEESIIDILLEENDRLRFSCINSIFHVPSTQYEEYPEFPQFDTEKMYPIPLNLLSDMFVKVNVAVPTQEQKLYGAPPGALFVVDDSGVEMAGTNGLTMAYVRLNGLNIQTEKTVVLPKKLLEELPKMLVDWGKGKEDDSKNQDTEIDTKIGIMERQIIFSWPNTQVFSCFLENKFPDYKEPIEVINDKVIVLDRERFRQAVRRVSLISEKREWFIRLRLIPGKLFLDSENIEIGDAHDEIDVNYNGEPLHIGFNPKYILDFLSVIDSPEVSLEMKDHESLAILRPRDFINIKFIIMPMRL